MEVTIGNLIDRLSIVNIRIWMAEDIKRKAGASDMELADATRITNVANTERNMLIQAIDEALGQQSFKQGDNKMYGAEIFLKNKQPLVIIGESKKK